MRYQGAGRFSTWPALSFLGFTAGFADSNEARLMPCLRAMLARVSPADTVWVRMWAELGGDAGRCAEDAVPDVLYEMVVAVADCEVVSSGVWLVFCG